MLSSFESEIAHLPLDKHYWPKDTVSRNEIGFKLLLIYYLQWPDRIAKIRCANEIAQLLKSDESDTFKALYLEHLRYLQYEADVVDFISILPLIEPAIFDEASLLRAIPYHCILTNVLLRRMGYSYNPALYKGQHLEGSTEYQAAEGFYKAKNIGIAPIYMSRIIELGTEVDYPLYEHISAEWTEISGRKEFLYFNAYDFSMYRFQSNTRIFHCLSTNSESMFVSAYLRTLSFAANKFSIPDDRIEYLASVALPFDNELIQLLPGAPPAYWPVVNPVDIADRKSLKKQLRALLYKLAKNQQLTLAASGPVLREYPGISIDLEVYAVSFSNEVPTNNQQIFNTVIGSSVSHDPDNIRPLAIPKNPGILGRWDVDKFSRGLFAPAVSITKDPANIKFLGQEVQYCEAVYVNACWKYWHYHWTSVHHRRLGPSVGSFLLAEPKTSETLRAKLNKKLYLIGKFTILDDHSSFTNIDLVEIFMKVKA